MTAPAGWYPDPDGSGGQQRKTPDAKVLVGLGAAAVILLAAIGLGVYLMVRTGGTEAAVDRRQADETTAPLGETAAAQTGIDEHVPSIGHEVRDGNFAFVVAGVERVDAVADPEFPGLQKAAAGEYVIVRMTVTNIGTQPQTFFASFNTLSDGATTYESDDEAWIYLGNTLADLNPGDSIDTAVVFDVPDGTRAESVELHDGPVSDGVTVELE